MRSNTRLAIWLTTAALMATATPVVAEEIGAASTERQAAHTILLPDQLQWQPAPPGLPPGAELAVLHGDPGAEGKPFVARLKMPAGYYVAPHSHSIDENLTIVSGAMIYGMGKKADKSSARTLPAGTYLFLPGNETHFVWAGENGTVLEIQAMGPFDINYVDAADDPRASLTATAPQ